MMKYYSLILLFFVLKFQSEAQIPVKNMVFEGAGIRGIAYSGVIAEFEKAGLLDSLERVGGTSAGAITALALALGYKADEIQNIIYNTDFGKFNSGRFFFFGGGNRMLKRYGWYRCDKFYDWLDKIIESRTNNPDITFREMHEKGYKDLYVTGVSLSSQKLIIFSKDTYPDMKIRDAVRISMSVPLYFQAAFIDSTGKVYSKPARDQQLDVVIDGGVLMNFPIQIFDKKDSSGNRVPDRATVGVRIDSDEQIAYDNSNKGLAPYEINNLQDYVGAFYIIILENLNRASLTADDWKRTVSVSSVNIGPRVKKLSSSQKHLLIGSGRKSAVKFIEGRKGSQD
jgi:NTE family protein